MLQIFSWNYKTTGGKVKFFFFLLDSPHDHAKGMKDKTFGNDCCGSTANMRDKKFIQSHAPVSILPFLPFNQGSKMQKPSEPLPCPTAVQGLGWKGWKEYMHACAHVWSSLCTHSLSVVCVCQRVQRMRGGEGSMWSSKVSGPPRKTIKHQWQEQMAFFIVPWNANSEYLCLVCGFIIYLFSPSCPFSC